MEEGTALILGIVFGLLFWAFFIKGCEEEITKFPPSPAGVRATSKK